MHHFCINVKSVVISFVVFSAFAAVQPISAMSSQHNQHNTPTRSPWSEFSSLARKHNAINLGQGFPDWDPPSFVTDALVRAVHTRHNQYTRSEGHPALVEALARRYSKHFQRVVDAYQHIAITPGASQALYVTMQTLLEPGDEVIVFEPGFDLYRAQAERAGGVVRGISMKLRDNEWFIDTNDVEAAITPRTKLLVVNTPHNPTGMVFGQAVLERIAAIVRKHRRIVVIVDEVYKHTIYHPVVMQRGTGADAPGHVHFASLDDMWERTVTLSSAGKTFSVTGWQVGWAVGPEQLIQPIHAMLPVMQFCTATPLQQAFAEILNEAELPFEGHRSYYDWLRVEFKRKRDMLVAGLEGAGVRTLSSSGGYFIMGDLSNIDVPPQYRQNNSLSSKPPDWTACRFLTEKAGVSAIPASLFYSAGRQPVQRPLARFTFCKQDTTLAEAIQRLAAVTEKAT